MVLNHDEWVLVAGLALQSARLATDIWKTRYEHRQRRGGPPNEEPPSKKAA